MLIGPCLALAAGACFGLANVLARIAIDRSSILHAATWSVLVSSVVLSAATLVIATVEGIHLGPTAVLCFVGAGVTADFGARFCLYGTTARLGAARASGFRVLAPLVSIVGGIVVFREELSLVSIGGLGVILLGLAIVTWDQASLARVHGESVSGAPSWRRVRVGIGFGIAAAMLFGFGDMFRKAGVSEGGDIVAGTLITAATAMSIYVCIGVHGRQVRMVLAPRPDAAVALAATGACVCIAVLLTMLALVHAPVGVVSSITASQVLFAMLFGYALNQQVEQVSRLVVIGGLCVLGGVALVMDGM